MVAGASATAPAPHATQHTCHTAAATPHSGCLTPFLPPVTAGLSEVTSAASACRGVHSTACPPVYSQPRQASGATGRPRLAAVSVVTSTVPSLVPAASSCIQQWSSLICWAGANGEQSSEHRSKHGGRFTERHAAQRAAEWAVWGAARAGTAAPQPAAFWATRPLPTATCLHARGREVSVLRAAQRQRLANGESGGHHACSWWG